MAFFAKACVVLTILHSFVFAAAVPSGPILPRTPDVPWKSRGLSSRKPQGYPTGCTNGPKSRGCWVDGTSIDTDFHRQWPNTGKTVTYDFEITNTTMAPDGVERLMLVINGQYPGPTIEADWGDYIKVNVKNSLELNGTGIHWHGFRQVGTNEMDGVGGITECPIAPGETRTYEFQAIQYGSSWYHSHYSVQYGDGIVGGIVIHGPATANYDIDLGLLPFTDWFHTPIFTVNAAALHATGPPIADNVLVNGTMTSGSGGSYAVTNLQPGKKHLLRLVNTGINNWIHVGLQGHEFTVIAADFVPIEPFTASTLSLSVGQRYDVIIDASQPVNDYWLYVGVGGNRCDGPNTNAANIRSIFHYEGAKHQSNASAVTLPGGCYDEEGIVPYHKNTVPRKVPKELNTGFTTTAAGTNLVQWLINGEPILVDFTRPTLKNVIDGNDTFNTKENLFTVGDKNEWQYWVIQQDSTTPPLPHPIHLHGHDFFVLDHAANANWTGDISRLKMDNPVRRDTATLPARGYLVLAFESDNPGAWLMHCHIPFHVSAGFGLQFLERVDEIPGILKHTEIFEDQCASWKDFQTEFYPNGFELGDSGL
ncbi:multicopper oxidase [Aaosphaeria arxii CBS 175.79]|uniref:Multicopper oxidase n=2 Tax=Pleosporales TaxID=92860 RepID=A0A6A5XDQ0_9PLEO|nr:multicopper oxidase [Aaosphaeria arxii CBS 175.79]KAF2010981.1 multicopper oxidase [Aaosphaeria arxii CBS 175.79]